MKKYIYDRDMFSICIIGVFVNRKAIIQEKKKIHLSFWWKEGLEISKKKTLHDIFNTLMLSESQFYCYFLTIQLSQRYSHFFLNDPWKRTRDLKEIVLINSENYLCEIGTDCENEIV